MIKEGVCFLYSKDKIVTMSGSWFQVVYRH